jgi:hypothetical protein
VGVWLNVAFANAPLPRVEAAVRDVLAAHEHREAAWEAPADLQYARAATTPWWAVGGFEGAPGWTCLLAAPYDVWTADRGARLGELSRAIDAECWSFDAYDGDSMRVMAARRGRVSRAGFLSDELDAGMEFDPSMTLPLLNDVTIAGAVTWARATYPHDFVWRFDGGAGRQVPATDVVDALAREDVSDVQAAVTAIAMVFGGDRHQLVDNLTIIECLIRRERAIDAAPSFTLFTRA